MWQAVDIGPQASNVFTGFNELLIGGVFSSIITFT